MDNNLDIFEETMSEEERLFYATRPRELIRNLREIEAATRKNLKAMVNKIDCDTTPQEHKFIQEAINKGGEALGVLGKASMIQPASPSPESVRMVSDIKTIKDFYDA